MILSASPLEQNRILGDTDLGEVAEAAPLSQVRAGGNGSRQNRNQIRPPTPDGEQHLDRVKAQVGLGE